MQHPFQQVLQIIRSQPDLHYVFEAKRASECCADRFDIRSIPDRGVVLVTGYDVDNERLKFLSHVLASKRTHIAFALCESGQALVPEHWCKRSVLRNMLTLRKRELPILILVDFMRESDFRDSFKRQLFMNARCMNLLVLAVVPNADVPSFMQQSIDIKVKIGGKNGLTRVNSSTHRQPFYYVSPYTIALERYKRDKATQVEIYRESL